MFRVYAIKTLLYLLAWLPLPVSHGLGAFIGLLMGMLPNSVRDVTRTNIELCFPDLPLRERQSLINRCLRETGKTALEIAALWLRPPRWVLGQVREIEGLEHVEAALSQGQGMVLVTPHIGAWEVCGVYAATHYDITCLYRPLRIPGLEQLVHNARSRAGGNYVPATAQGIRSLYRTLDQKQVVAMLPDQEPKAGTGLFAPFFGVPAYTMVFLSRLARKTAAPVVFLWSERLPYGRGYRLHFRPARTAIYAEDLDVSVGAVNRCVEDLIRECPAQYQWNYRRFRTRPEGEPRIY